MSNYRISSILIHLSTFIVTFLLFSRLTFSKQQEATQPSFRTATYDVTLVHRCLEEGCVSCSNYELTLVNRKTGEKIQLDGSTLHSVGADGETPSHFLGNRFKKGDLTYFINDENTLSIIKNETQVILEETAESSPQP